MDRTKVTEMSDEIKQKQIAGWFFTTKWNCEALCQVNSLKQHRNSFYVSYIKKKVLKRQSFSCKTTNGTKKIRLHGWETSLNEMEMDFKQWLKLSPISRQLFRSRLGCYACMLCKKKNPAVNLLSISATPCPRKASSLTVFLGAGRPGVACCTVKASQLDVKSSPVGNYFVKSLLSVLRRSLHSQSSTFSPRTVGGQTDWGGWCLPGKLFFPRLSTQFRHPQLKIKRH